MYTTVLAFSAEMANTTTPDIIFQKRLLHLKASLCYKKTLQEFNNLLRSGQEHVHSKRLIETYTTTISKSCLQVIFGHLNF